MVGPETSEGMLPDKWGLDQMGATGDQGCLRERPGLRERSAGRSLRWIWEKMRDMRDMRDAGGISGGQGGHRIVWQIS
jgi:hypothetical protein